MRLLISSNKEEEDGKLPEAEVLADAEADEKEPAPLPPPDDLPVLPLHLQMAMASLRADAIAGLMDSE